MSTEGNLMNRNRLETHPQRWTAKLSPMIVRLMRPVRVHRQLNVQGVANIEVIGAQGVTDVIRNSAGVLITPNHPGHADAECMIAASEIVGVPFHFMTAWQVFAAHGWFGQWIMQKHGCFSVDREGADREAFRTAVDIIQNKKNPLLVFAEGEVYHQNDRVTPFREGAAAMAIMAVKKADRPIYAIPAATKYRYIEDPTPALLDIMDRLEAKVLWRPNRTRSLRDRVYRLADGLIALKEIEYLGCANTNDNLPDRIETLANHILCTLEERYGIHTLAASGRGIDRTTPERVKDIRAAALVKYDETYGSIEERDHEAQVQISHDLDDVFLVVQLFSYPGDYLHEDAPIERLAETIDKFEEDVLGKPTASIHAKRNAVVSFGEPILVEKDDKATGSKRPKPRDLTRQLETGVQGLLDAIM